MRSYTKFLYPCPLWTVTAIFAVGVCGSQPNQLKQHKSAGKGHEGSMKAATCGQLQLGYEGEASYKYSSAINCI